MKDHTHKDGRKIGTTLLAAAITNHPFLEGMQALTLYNASTMGDLALVAQPAAAGAVHLAEIGQRVTFRPDLSRTPELTPAERATTYVITAVADSGEFVRLESISTGTPFGWFHWEQLMPARPNEDADPLAAPAMPDTNSRNSMMRPATEQKAAAFSTLVTALSKDRSTAEAFHLAQRDDPEGARAYRLCGISTEEKAEAAPVLNLSLSEGDDFDAAVWKYADQHGVGLREAIHEVGKIRPDWAAARMR